MEGIYLRLFVTERQMHHGKPLHEWLMQTAMKEGIRGGTEFRTTAGYGPLHGLHKDEFFELAHDLPIVVAFMMTDEEAQRFLKLIDQEQLMIFYIRSRAEFGFTGNR